MKEKQPFNRNNLAWNITGGILSLCVESMYSKVKEDFVFSKFLRTSGLLEGNLKTFKLMVKKYLLSMAHQLPGFAHLTPTRLKRSMPNVLKTWKSVLELEDSCVVRPQIILLVFVFLLYSAC